MNTYPCCFCNKYVELPVLSPEEANKTDASGLTRVEQTIAHHITAGFLWPCIWLPKSAGEVSEGEIPDKTAQEIREEVIHLLSQVDGAENDYIANVWVETHLNREETKKARHESARLKIHPGQLSLSKRLSPRLKQVAEGLAAAYPAAPLLRFVELPEVNIAEPVTYPGDQPGNLYVALVHKETDDREMDTQDAPRASPPPLPPQVTNKAHQRETADAPSSQEDEGPDPM